MFRFDFMNKKTATVICILALVGIPVLLQACVEAHPSYQVVSFNMAPATASTGEKVTVQAEVKNVNSQTDTFNVPLMVDGVADDRRNVTLAPGQIQTLTFELTRNRPGVYKIAVGGHESTLTVEKPSPAAFRFSDLEITPGTVELCESVVVTANLTNIGDSQGNFTAELKIDGIVNQAQKLNVPARGNCALCFKVSKSLPGIYQVALGDLTGEFTVKEAPEPVFNVPVAPPCPPSSQGSCTGYGS